MKFTKMHGCGNDYVYVNCFEEPFPEDAEVRAERVRFLSDRHFGVGGDGVIFICPPPAGSGADAEMRMFNADGSGPTMCGNGVRCVGKFVFDHGIARREEVRILVGTQMKVISLREVVNGRATRLCVDMGEPILDLPRIPTQLPTGVNCPLELCDAAGQPLTTLEVTAVSMGNPHCISFVDKITDEMVFGYGPQVENHPFFPERTNVEFLEVLSESELRMRVWERGTGETLACGTGACASCVAGVLTGRTGRDVQIHLLGGDLNLQWDEETNHVFMTGPAVEVFSGEID